MTQQEGTTVEVRRRDRALLRIRQRGGTWTVTMVDDRGREMGRLIFCKDDSSIFENGKEVETFW